MNKGFNKSYCFTESLERILTECGFKKEKISRPDATKLIWCYIKKHNLQNPGNKREILCDDVMREFTGKRKINMMEIAKHLGQNLIED